MPQGWFSVLNLVWGLNTHPYLKEQRGDPVLARQGVWLDIPVGACCPSEPRITWLAGPSFQIRMAFWHPTAKR
jgi:hypothetical protein